MDVGLFTVCVKVKVKGLPYATVFVVSDTAVLERVYSDCDEASV